MTYEELVEKAKREYPVGCKCDNSNIGRNYIFTIIKDGFVRSSVETGGISNNNGSVYLPSKGWAKVISYPEGYVIPNEELKLILW